VKLLLDENLPISLLGFVRQRCPGSTHVVEAGLQTTSDARIWVYAKRHELAIVTRDFDFVEHSAKERGPPRVARAGVARQ
jgi:predicted nuclease of predicted toxin-antitoxin system